MIGFSLQSNGDLKSRLLLSQQMVKLLMRAKDLIQLPSDSHLQITAAGVTSAGGTSVGVTAFLSLNWFTVVSPLFSSLCTDV